MKKLINLAFFTSGLIAVIFSSCTKEQNAANKAPSASTASNLSSKKATFSSAVGNIVEIDLSRGDTCYYWSKSGTVSSGSSTNSTMYRSPVSYLLPAGQTPTSVVAIAIASTNKCYFWYANGTMSVGISNDASFYIAPKPYLLPSGKVPTDILAISIAKSTDRVYTWYKDGTATVGNSTDLGAIRSPYPYSLPAGKSINDIVGIGIAGSNDHTYAWYNDGITKTVSSGYTNVLDAYFSPVPSTF